MDSMTERPEFEFVTTAACRDARVNNCPQVATNVPGIVALRDSDRPDVVVTFTAPSGRTCLPPSRAESST
ncbi:DUF397 domain-containing protein [Streptomyces sp. NPDC006984]|uniref:DUF397 domain-containing protein n=1 Tax=Streptomyces sp. NPDC006984 TaxID=3155463 RepID=UPI0033C26F2D